MCRLPAREPRLARGFSSLKHTIHLARGLPRSSPRHVAICVRVTGPTEPLTRLPLDNRPHMLVLSGDRHKAEVLDRVVEATENPAVKTA